MGWRFDYLCRRFTVPRVVRCIKMRCLRILESRDPSLGEAVREMVES